MLSIKLERSIILLFILSAGAAFLAAPPATAVSTYPQPRVTVPVVVHAVVCSADLLHCRDINLRAGDFADSGACRNRLPALIAAAKARRAEPNGVVMARCRFAPAFARRIAPGPNSGFADSARPGGEVVAEGDSQ